MRRSANHETTSSPRILFLDHVGAIGGAELSLLDIATHFRASGEVLLFADGPFRRRLGEAGVTARVAGSAGRLDRVRRDAGLWRGLQAIPDIGALAAAVARASRGFDILYANSQKAAVIGALSRLATGKPVIWHLRDILTGDHFSRLNVRVAIAIANALVDRIIANSAATRAAFIASGGSAAKCAVVYNGIDALPFAAVTDEAMAALRPVLAVGDAPIVGVFSRIAGWKGQHVLLEALARLPGFRAILVGDALFPEDEAYLAHLRRQCDALGLGGRVHFLGFRRDVPALLKLCDVVAHTSTAPEPFGRVIVEAMLAGRPIVASAAGGVPEIIEAGRTGLLVPPGDPEALAAALARMRTEPGLAAGLAAAAKADALARFSLPSMLRQIDGHVHEVAARHRPQLRPNPPREEVQEHRGKPQASHRPGRWSAHRRRDIAGNRSSAEASGPELE